MSAAFWMAAFNATINAVSAGVILYGHARIRRDDARAHRKAMVAATALQGLFLVVYGLKTWWFGVTPFEGEPGMRAIYLALLGAHVAGATLIVPLVGASLVLALTGRTRQHRAVSRWTFPLWVFVSVSGPLTFLMLYGLGRPAGG
ncbi:DUF420 domain-containing protein [Carboxydochorda subterranea]|uniref:DUF420 domain-containing protein n=1 Tax=Carboxydichorda subterranea TaxID=3109565 RepID=A0ABZ1C098_9FIRM|nr:DUF420 domain-containing protein [Limnochorda sp. L945t]WRP18535.1 DUF420 domain-containing protein [Limnochorda sp. L945t]